MTKEHKPLGIRFEEEMAKFIDTTVELTVADRKVKKAVCRDVLVALARLPSLEEPLSVLGKKAKEISDLIEQMLSEKQEPK